MAAGLLLDVLRSDPEHPLTPTAITVPTRLVVRHTTAGPRPT